MATMDKDNRELVHLQDPQQTLQHNILLRVITMTYACCDHGLSGLPSLSSSVILRLCAYDTFGGHTNIRCHAVQELARQEGKKAVRKWKASDSLKRWLDMAANAAVCMRN
jgi:hypothetical protein